MRIRTLVATSLVVALCLLPRPDGAARAVGPCAPPGGVSALATAPDGELLAGTVEGRLYRSRDGGHCFALLPGAPLPMPIGLLLAPPGHPSLLIAGFALGVATTGRAYGCSGNCPSGSFQYSPNAFATCGVQWETYVIDKNGASSPQARFTISC